MSYDFFDLRVFDNPVLDYLIFFSVLIGGMLLVKIIDRSLFRRLKDLTRKTSTLLDDFLIEQIDRTALPLLYFGAFYLSSRTLTLHPYLHRGLDILGIILLTLYGARLLSAVVIHALQEYWLKREENTSRQRTILGLFPVIKILIWGAGIVFLLDNLGFEVSAVIAGLGIGGIAVALAAQTVLGDLFSYFAIFFDRPFEIGDFIIIDSYMGTIEKIGIKTTRIRSLGGELLIFSNSDLTSSRMRNYKRMEKRRIVFQLGVTYETPLEKLKEIPTIISNIIKAIDLTVFDRAHFASYGDFSLNFEVVYLIRTNDYNKYMDVQQTINLAIFEEFSSRAIDFAYPTQTLYTNKIK